MSEFKKLNDEEILILAHTIASVWTDDDDQNVLSRLKLETKGVNPQDVRRAAYSASRMAKRRYQRFVVLMEEIGFFADEDKDL
jgi:hypothetical protein